MKIRRRPSRFGVAVKAEQKGRLEVVDHASVASGGGVMELVNDDVVESVAREADPVSGQRLDAGEQHSGVGLLRAAVIEAEFRVWLHAREDLEGLPQDLLAMRDEKHAAELRPSRVKSGKPGLA